MIILTIYLVGPIKKGPEILPYRMTNKFSTLGIIKLENSMTVHGVIFV